MIGPIRLSDEAKAGKCRERVGSPDGSHLSPDGGSLSRAAVHRLAADGYDSAADNASSQNIATCRQTVEPTFQSGIHRLIFQKIAPSSFAATIRCRLPGTASCRIRS